MSNGIESLLSLARKEYAIKKTEAQQMMALSLDVFRETIIESGGERRQITRLTTKFRDAGRRSAPWRPTSSRVPGRPQDGADGNRINRWLLPTDHKFYADEITATLVEIRYIFQTLSMDNAPELDNEDLKEGFTWLLGHRIEPGFYLDPIQLIPVNFNDFYANPRLVQSGHLVPLDRGGRHKPDNAFLMLKVSNDLQGSLTLDELLELMEQILQRHKKLRGKLTGD